MSDAFKTFMTKVALGVAGVVCYNRLGMQPVGIYFMVCAATYGGRA